MIEAEGGGSNEGIGSMGLPGVALERAASSGGMVVGGVDLAGRPCCN